MPRQLVYREISLKVRGTRSKRLWTVFVVEEAARLPANWRLPSAGSKVATASRRRRGLFARSATDRVVAGVSGGLAEALGVDAVVIRLAFVVLGLAGGFGLALYLIGWLASGDPISGAPRGRSLQDSLTRSRHAQPPM